MTTSRDLPALPAGHAFVLQFARETDPQTGHFVGRIEHVISGRRTRFDSPDAVLAFVSNVLANQSSPDQEK